MKIYVKVLDFGIAKLMEAQVTPTSDESPTVIKVETEEGAVMGTAPYMSPEQARGQPVDSRTDIWSFGVLLYESITGRKPFWGETTTDVMAAILKSEPSPLNKFKPETPAEVERIVRKTLAKAPDERYQTAKDLLLDLRQVRKQLEIQSEIERTAAPGKSESENSTQVISARPTSSAEYVTAKIRQHRLGYAVAALLILSVVGIALGYRFFGGRSSTPAQIESIAVLPFVNESGNNDVEYLSDGMTESLINSLSQLPRLSVKARSTVFRYKAKQIDPQNVARELSVQAILNGRVVQRGDDLTLYRSLVDGRTGNQIWGDQYNRKLNDLVNLQGEIARDVSRRVQARLSGADERKLSRGQGTSTEAYQLYLKGRYHFVRLTAPELQTAASYFQGAIDIDPVYAAAYAGLSQVYRALTLSGELPATELLPKAKLMAQKAVALDNELGDAHAALGIVTFFYDWKLDEAEHEFKRALELDPNNSDTHQFYAIMLTGAGRHPEAIAEIKRALDLDPLNVLANAHESQVFVYAGQYDEALASARRAYELEPNFWFAHFWASAAYTEKGMYSEAVNEASKSRQILRVGTHQTGFLAYALAKWGKQAEARAELDGVLKLAAQQYVSPYNVAWIYNGLDDREQTFAWLERAYQQRDPKMVIIKVDPKFKNLRDDPRFQGLLRRVGF